MVFRSSSSMPTVGGRVLIEGLAAFQQASQTVIKQFGAMNAAALKLATAPLPDLGRTTAYSRLRVGDVTAYTRFPGIMAAATAATIGAGAAITGLGIRFEKTGRAVQVFGDTTEREMQNIQKQSVQLSRSFTTSANDISKAAVNLGKAGAPIEDLNNNVIKSAVVFEQAAQSEITAAAAGDLIVQTITALGLKYTDSTKIVDTYVGAVNKTTLTYTELTDNMRQLLPVLGALNMTQLDGAAALGLLAEAGLRGTIGGTALKNALIALADPSEEAAEIMKKYSLTIFDAQGKTLPMIEIIGRLHDAFGDTAEGVTDAQKIFATTDIFSTRQILAAFSLIKQGPAAFAQLKAAIQDVSSEEVARGLQRNIIDQIKLVGNNVLAAANTITDRFIPSLLNASTATSEAFQRQNFTGLTELGDTINEVITFNNNFTNSLIRAVFPGLIVAAEGAGTLRDMLLELLGINIESFGKGVLGVGRLVGIGFALGGVAAEELAKQLRALPETVLEVATAIRVLDKYTGIFTNTYKGLTAYLDYSIGIWRGVGNAIEGVVKTIGVLASTSGLAESVISEMNAERENARKDLDIIGTTITKASTDVLGTIAAGIDIAADVTDAAIDRALVKVNDKLAAAQRAFLPGMSGSMGFWDEVLGKRGSIPAARPVGGGSTYPPSSGGGGKEDIDKIAARIREMLRDLPAMNQELAEFLAGIGQDFPARIGPMVSTLLGARDAVGQLVIAKRDMLAVDLQLIESAARLSDLEGQMGRLELEQAKAVLGYDQQLLGLRHQLLEIDKQTWPIRDAIADIERTINQLQRENFALTRQRITLEIQALPLRRQMEDIEKRISALTKTNWESTRAQLLLEQQALPFKRQIREIEEKITDAVDRRGNLLRRREELQAEGVASGIRDQLTDTEKALKDAWADMNVPTILALEEQKKALEKSLEGAESQLSKIQREQAAVARATELTTIEYELQKLEIEASLKPINDKLQALTDTEEITRILNEITNTYLQQEKEALAAIMESLQDKLDAISDEVTLENLRNALLISHLEEEKQRLNDMLIPYEDQRKAIERIIAEVDLMRARTALEFEERKIGIQAMLIDEKIRQAALIETQRQQNILFSNLVLGFITSLAESKNFTLEEGLEVSKRLGLWSDQLDKLVETTLEFARMKAAATVYAEYLAAIPNKEIIVTTIHRDVYEGTGGNTAVRVSQATSGEQAAANRATTVGGTTVNHNYNVSASYQEMQSPASISQDLRALIMASSRG